MVAGGSSTPPFFRGKVKTATCWPMNYISGQAWGQGQCQHPSFGPLPADSGILAQGGQGWQGWQGVSAHKLTAGPGVDKAKVVTL